MATKTGRVSKTLIARVLYLTPVLATLGCGADFDSQDWVKSLRVLGVQHGFAFARRHGLAALLVSETARHPTPEFERLPQSLSRP